MRKWKDCVSDHDKFLYHADVDAWRRVRQGASVDEKTSPVDPEGKWFDEYLVRQAAAALQAKSRPASRFAFTDEELEERRDWARLRGYADWAVALDAIQAGRESIMAFLAWSVARREGRGPPQVGTFIRLGAALTPATGDAEGAAIALAASGANDRHRPEHQATPPPPPDDVIHQAHAELGVRVTEAAE